MFRIHFKKDKALGFTDDAEMATEQDDFLYGFLQAPITLDEDVTLLDFLRLVTKSSSTSDLLTDIFSTPFRAILAEMEPGGEMIKDEILSIGKRIEAFETNHQNKNWIAETTDMSIVKDGQKFACWGMTNAELGRLRLGIEATINIAILDKQYKDKANLDVDFEPTFYEFMTVMANELAFAPLDKDKEDLTKMLLERANDTKGSVEWKDTKWAKIVAQDIEDM
jgi:hypothetical protein